MGTTRVVLGQPGMQLRKGVMTQTRKVIRLHDEINPEKPRMMEYVDEQMEKIRDVLAADSAQEWDVFVDGSYRKNRGGIESIIDNDQVKLEAGAGIVFIKRSEDWYKHRVYNFRITGVKGFRIKSGFDMELIALSYVCLIQQKLELNAIIFTDCE